MFMFRRRTSQVKRLLNARVQCDETGREAQVKKLVKRLSDKEVEMLLSAVLSGGGGGCVLTAAEDRPQLVACQAWRWPDLAAGHEMKQLPSCQSRADSACCNPFHWSRLCRPDTPPPPYRRYPTERVKPEEGDLSEESQPELRGSLSTNGEGDSDIGGQWCRLAYWELAHRIGRQFAVATPFVNVFWNVPHGDGLCLSSLAVHNKPSDPVRKAREKIGRGLTLSKEKDGVWAYNRSEVPVFINSPCLEGEGRLVVCRLPPGHCLNIYTKAPGTLKVPPHAGPVDPNSVRISFVKGWGPRYSRQDVTACPTWLEVLLAPCR